MAQIPVEPAPKRTPWWAWLLGLVVLAGLVFLLLDQLDLGDGRPPVEQADTRPPTDVVITDVAALAGATSASDIVGRQVNIPNAEVVDVLSDSLVFINVTGAGVAANANVAEQQPGADTTGGGTPPALGGATGIAIFGDRVLVLLEPPATGTEPGASAAGLQPGQAVVIQGQVQRVQGSRAEGLDLSDEQREQVDKSGLYIRADRISTATEGAPPAATDTTGA